MQMFKELCRICLNNPGAISIYDKGGQTTIIEAIFLITRIQISSNNKFPNTICVSCLESINSALKLCEDVKYAEEKLNQIEIDIAYISVAGLNNDEAGSECSAGSSKHSSEREEEQFQTKSAACASCVIEIDDDDEDESLTSKLVKNSEVVVQKLMETNDSDRPVFEIDSDEAEPSTLRKLLLKGVTHTEEQLKDNPDVYEQLIIIEDDSSEDEGEKSAFELREYIKNSEDTKETQISGQETFIGDEYENDGKTTTSSLIDEENILELEEHNSSNIKQYLGKRRNKRATNKKVTKTAEVINEIHINPTMEQSETYTTEIPIDQLLKNADPIVNGDKFKCKICAQQFFDVSSHRLHMVHSHESLITLPIFECQRCSKMFSQRYLLKRHIDMHCDKTQICSFCGKGFSRPYTLKEHIRIVHFKEKRFQCTICNKAFGTAANLRSHFRCLHINDKPFQCKYCNNKFFRLRYLQNHIAKNHSNELID